MSVYRPVRVGRRPSGEGLPPPRLPGSEGAERLENAGAGRRAVRLAVVHVVAVGAIYAVLGALALSGPGGRDAAVGSELLYVGLLAVVLAAVGAVVALDASPRAIIFAPDRTVVVGRFGRRYRFPARAELRATVRRRFPAGRLSPEPIVAVEIDGGATRRQFLMDDGLLPTGAPDRPG